MTMPETNGPATDSTDEHEPADSETETATTDSDEGEQVEEDSSTSGDADQPKDNRRTLRQRAQRAESLADKLVRREVERVAGEKLVDGRDIWAAVPDLSAVLTDDGTDLDPGKLDAVVAKLAAERPHWVKSVAAPAEQVTSDGKATGPDGPKSWSDVFKEARRHGQASTRR